MTTSPSATTGRAVLLLLAVVILAAAILPWMLVDDVPDRLATRWGLDGQPTASSRAGVLLAVSLALSGVAAACLLVMAVLRRPMTQGSRPVVAGSAALVGAVIAAPVIQILGSNQGHDDWREVPGPASWQIGGIIILALAAGAVAAWAASGFDSRVVGPQAAEPLDVPDTAQVSWSRSLTVAWLLALGVASAVGGVVLVAFGQVGIGLVFVLTALPFAFLSRISVFADRRGLTVTYGWWSWPRTRVSVEDIEQVAAIDVVPSQWGGWGYRGSLKLFRQAAVVLRGGPGVQLDLRDGRRFAVTIDDPETAAAVLSRELVRSR